MKAIVQVLFIAFVLGVTPYAFYTLGYKVSSYRITSKCLSNSTFTEGTDSFRCINSSDPRSTPCLKQSHF